MKKNINKKRIANYCVDWLKNKPQYNIVSKLSLAMFIIMFCSTYSFALFTCTTINTTASFGLCDNETLEVNEVEYTVAGIYTQTLLTVDGCDSIVEITITELLTDTDNPTIVRFVCPDDSVEIEGQFFQIGTDELTLGNEAGCDSVLVIQVNEYNVRHTITEEVCTGDSVMVNENYYQIGTAMDTLFNASVDGCDSILTIVVNELLIDSVTINGATCTGETYEYLGANYNIGTTIIEETNQAGCDSIVTIIVEELEETFATQTYEICEGETVSINGVTYNEGGTYYQTFANSDSCNFNLTIEIEVLNYTYSYQEFEICPGDSILLNGNYFTTTYGFAISKMDGSILDYYEAYDTLTNAEGCDSFLIADVYPYFYPFQEFEQVCVGDSVMILDVYYQAGIYTDSLTSVEGCDSVVVITIEEVLPETETTTVEFCAGGEVEVNGEVYNLPGIYLQTLDPDDYYYDDDDDDYYGDLVCDLQLTVIVNELESSSDTVRADVCTGETYEYLDEEYAIGEHTDYNVNVFGCDSNTIFIINELFVNDTTLFVQVCSDEDSVMVNDVNYGYGETATDSMTNAAGCDSLVYTTITFDETNPVCVVQDITVYLDSMGSVSVMTSETDNGSFDDCGLDEAINVEITYDCDNLGANDIITVISDLQGNVASCDVTITVADTIFPTCITKDTVITLDATGEFELDSYDLDFSEDNCWIESAEFSRSLTFTCMDVADTNFVTMTVTDNFGNESTCVSEIFVNPYEGPSGSYLVYVCDNETVTVNGNEYGVGVFTEIIPSAIGCDSTINITVEGYNSYDETEIYAVCEGETTFVGGIEYEPGTYVFDNTTTENGCDSILTIIIEELLPSYNTIDLILCEEYDYDYYYDEGLLEHGDSYFGYVYFEGEQYGYGTYTITSEETNAVGCDSIITLNVIEDNIAPMCYYSEYNDTIYAYEDADDRAEFIGYMIEMYNDTSMYAVMEVNYIDSLVTNPITNAYELALYTSIYYLGQDMFDDNCDYTLYYTLDDDIYCTDTGYVEVNITATDTKGNSTSCSVTTYLPELADTLVGCADPTAINYNEYAICDDGSCDYSCPEDIVYDMDVPGTFLETSKFSSTVTNGAVIGQSSSVSIFSEGKVILDDGSLNPSSASIVILDYNICID